MFTLRRNAKFLRFDGVGGCLAGGGGRTGWRARGVLQADEVVGLRVLGLLRLGVLFLFFCQLLCSSIFLKQISLQSLFQILMLPQ
jgi:hypothetical protein